MVREKHFERKKNKKKTIFPIQGKVREQTVNYHKVPWSGRNILKKKKKKKKKTDNFSNSGKS